MIHSEKRCTQWTWTEAARAWEAPRTPWEASARSSQTLHVEGKNEVMNKYMRLYWEGLKENTKSNQAPAIIRWEMKGHRNGKRCAGMRKKGGDTKTIATDITGQGEGGGKGDLQVLAWTGWMKGLCTRFLLRRWMKPSVAEDWRCSRWGSLQDTGFPVSPEWNITVLKIICYYLWPIVYFQKPKPSQLVANVLIQSSTQRD